MYCDIALEEAPATEGSFGKGTYILPTGDYAFAKWTKQELAEAFRKTRQSTTHLELANMLISVLSFASKEQKVLCICDNRPAVDIAKARYAAKENPAIEELLHIFDIECTKRDLVVRFRWQSRHDALPSVADKLSRGEVEHSQQHTHAMHPGSSHTVSQAFPSHILTIYMFRPKKQIAY